MLRIITTTGYQKIYRPIKLQQNLSYRFFRVAQLTNNIVCASKMVFRELASPDMEQLAYHDSRRGDSSEYSLAKLVCFSIHVFLRVLWRLFHMFLCLPVQNYEQHHVVQPQRLLDSLDH